MKKIIKKADFNFEFLFAIIAGGMILFLAIYGALKFGGTTTVISETEIAKKIAVLTNPMQAGFSEGKTSKIFFNRNVRLYNECYPEVTEFGENSISVSVESNVGEPWGEIGKKISVYNKYIFSSEMEEGKEMWIFSKPFNLPYKVADMIFITGNKYCFVDAPKEISSEVSDLKIENIQLSDKLKNCSSESVKVCFGAQNCEIRVFGSGEGESGFENGYVLREGKEMYYAGNLIYAAIFANPEIYECNLKRFLYRTGKVAEIYSVKADLMSARGCNSNMVPDLNAFAELIKNSNPENIIELYENSKSLNEKAKAEECNVW